jgi:hypothetical protein
MRCRLAQHADTCTHCGERTAIDPDRILRVTRNQLALVKKRQIRKSTEAGVVIGQLGLTVLSVWARW